MINFALKPTCIIFFIFFRCVNCIEIGLMKKSLEYLSNICLYSEICNATRKAEFNVSGNYEPCCSSCSCELVCVEERNCCFSDMYTMHDTVIERCIRLNSVQSDSIEYGRSFFMVAECINGGSDLSNETLSKFATNTSCTDEVFFPVSSVTTGYIYFNVLCAKCNGVTDATAWEVIVETVEPIRPYQVSLMTNKSILKKFDHEFVPPRNDKWSRKECQYTVDSCSPTYDNDTMNLLCHSIEVPIRIGFRMYKNVFCALCNGAGEANLILTSVCKASDTQRAKPSNFATLLDFAAFETPSSSWNLMTSSTKSDCFLNEVQSYNKAYCYTVFCPEGMTKIKGDDCMYIGSQWIGNYALNVQLRKTLDKPLTNDVVKELKTTDGKKLFDNILLPEKCKAFAFSGVMLFHEIESNFDDFKHLLVILYKIGNGEEESPQRVIESAQSCLNDYWRLKMKTESFIFKPSLFQMKYIPTGNSWLVKHSHIGNGSHAILAEKRFQYVNAGPQAMRTSGNAQFVRINKLYFCNQLYLPLDEVEFGYGELVIVSTGKKLYENEFAVVDDSRVAVCVEDYIADSSASSSVLQQESIKRIQAVFVYLCVCAMKMR